MAHIEGFNAGVELKKYISGIDASVDIDNLESSLRQAAVDVRDIISPEVYSLYIKHVELTDIPDAPAENEASSEAYLRWKMMEEMAELLRVPLSAIAFHHHFIWLTIRVSNSGVTTTKSTQETTAYKYQTSEAKNSLLQRAYAGYSDLIDFLTEHADKFSDFAPAFDYKADDLISQYGTFYKANADFTSLEAFDAADWTQAPASEVFLLEWTLSDQKRESESLIFTNYRDFDKYYGIDRSAAFFIKARHIIRKNIMSHLKPRFGTAYPADLMEEIKTFLAYQTVADAIIRLDINWLPESIRGPINDEMNKKGGDVQFIRENLRNKLIEDAKDFLKGIDMARSSKAQTGSETPSFIQFEVKPDADRKYVSSL